MTETPDTRPAPLPEEVETLPAPAPEVVETLPAPLLPDDHHDLRPAPAPETKAVTANGWPYVTPADHPKEYPAVSQVLANKLQASVPPGLPSSIRFGVISGPPGTVVTFNPPFPTSPYIIVGPYDATTPICAQVVSASAGGFAFGCHNLDGVPVSGTISWIALIA